MSTPKHVAAPLERLRLVARSTDRIAMVQAVDVVNILAEVRRLTPVVDAAIAWANSIEHPAEAWFADELRALLAAVDACRRSL